MSLTAGTRLGPYEIVSQIGAGGMGEVYKATDTRLNRIIAIKVLPEHLAGDPQRLARFQRQAQTISSLNHPHICALHDVGEENGTHFLVMEYVEGEALDQRLQSGPVPLDDALTYAKQIADALEKAHQQGIVHRDLKPANVMITKSGVKLIDFGLVHLTAESASGSPLTNMPTQGDSELTAEGTILGTFRYMSPEQVEGKDVDARTDIYALCLVIYEMITGKKAIDGETQASLIAAILKDKPTPITELQPITPPQLDRVVQTRLEKDPEKRWQSAREVRHALEWIGLETPTRLAPEHHPVVRRSAWLWAIVAFVGGGLLTGAILWNSAAVTETAGFVQRTAVILDPSDELAFADSAPLGVGRRSIALSPDGTYLAYVVEREGQTRLYSRRMDEFEATALPGTEGAFGPFFSPDGQWIGFFTANQLRRISVEGTALQTLAEVGNVYGASWGENDTIVLADGEGVRLSIVSAEGGEPHTVLTADPARGEGSFNWPEFLLDGRVLLTIWSFPGSYRIAVVNLDTGDRQELIARGSGAQYISATGHLVYTGEGGLLATPFDLATLTVGNSAPVLQDVRRESSGIAQFTFSASGSAAYAPGDDMGLSIPTWVDREGREEPLQLPTQRYGSFSLSPDDRMLAIQVNATTSDIWLYDFERAEGLTRFTTAGNNAEPIWSADGRRLTFFSDDIDPNEEAVLGLFERPIDGGQKQLLWGTTVRGYAAANSRNGDELLVFTSTGLDSSNDIWVIEGGGRPDPVPFLQGPSAEWGGTLSPDSGWIAYTSDETGQYEVYVKPYPPTDQRIPISSGYGEEAFWSRDGDEIFYRRGNEWLSVPVSVTPDGFNRQGSESLALEGRYVNVAGISYTVTRDAQRFLVLKEIEQPPATRINIVSNWFAELTRLAPTGD